MTRPITIVIPAVLFAGAALADDAGLMRCRAIADNNSRLACYDALAKQVETTRFGLPPAAPAAAPAPAPAPAAKAEAPRPASPEPAKAVASAPATASSFGLEARQVPETDRIESSIQGRFEGWGPNQQIRLANGQLWQIADNSSAYVYKENPKVWVRRGALGVFYLEIENSNRSARVKRVE